MSKFPHLLTQTDVCKILGCSRDRLRELQQQGVLTLTPRQSPEGKRLYFSRDELNAALSGPTAGALLIERIANAETRNRTALDQLVIVGGGTANCKLLKGKTLLREWDDRSLGLGVTLALSVALPYNALLLNTLRVTTVRAAKGGRARAAKIAHKNIGKAE